MYDLTVNAMHVWYINIAQPLLLLDGIGETQIWQSVHVLSIIGVRALHMA